VKKIITLSVLALLLGCSQPGDEYIGVWQNITNEADRFEVMRNGDAYVIVIPGTIKTPTKTATAERKIPAIFKDSSLQPQGSIPIALAHVKASDTILGRGWLGASTEFKRVSR
jgi:hypothetical protein